MSGADRISDLSLFLRVLDAGSISAAARTLDLSVPAASQGLQRLERALGVRLLHRTTRRLTLTPEGESLAVQGRPLIEDLEALTSSLGRVAREATGTLRLSAPASFGRHHLSPLLPQFLVRYPHIDLQLDLSDQIRDVVREGLDLAIRIGQPRGSRLVVRRLAPDPRVLCAAPSYLRRRGRPRVPADLVRHDCLLLSVGNAAHDTWRLRAADGGETPVRVHGRLESNFGEVIRDAAIAGFGIAMHSMWQIHDDLRSGRLEVVLPEFTLPESGIYAVLPQRRMVPPRVRAFVDFLVGALRSNGEFNARM